MQGSRSKNREFSQKNAERQRRTIDDLDDVPTHETTRGSVIKIGDFLRYNGRRAGGKRTDYHRSRVSLSHTLIGYLIDGSLEDGAGHVTRTIHATFGMTDCDKPRVIKKNKVSSKHKRALCNRRHERNGTETFRRISRRASTKRFSRNVRIWFYDR